MSKVIIKLLLIFFISACSRSLSPSLTTQPKIQTGNLPEGTMEVTIPYLSNCTHSLDQLLQFNPDEPMIILAHGCNGSAGKFLALANVFAFHGQQTVCFNYNDRDSMMTSSAQFIRAVRALREHMNNPKITVIAHSQGGLVARKALIQERTEASQWEQDIQLHLITISSPFAGISAAKYCGSNVALFLSLGASIPICQMITGDKWSEIHHSSDFIQQPGTLIDPVDYYLKIVTDERESCLYQNEAGECIENDYIFTVEEQYFTKVDIDPLLVNVEVDAGHMEIVGDENIIPTKLINILQKQGIMNPTPPASKKELVQLLETLY